MMKMNKRKIQKVSEEKRKQKGGDKKMISWRCITVYFKWKNMLIGSMEFDHRWDDRRKVMTKGRRRKIALLLVFALACTLCDFNNIGIKSAFASEETVSDTTSSVHCLQLVHSLSATVGSKISSPSSKNKRRDICLSAFHAQGCRP